MVKKVRVNITVDEKLLKQARKKLNLFGGKMSTLFNAYLSDFVKTMDSRVGEKHDELNEKIKLIEKRIEKLEGER